MSDMVEIEPVPRADWSRALDLLAPEGRAGARKVALWAMLSGPQAKQCRFWWARDGRSPRAAAISLRNPGRTAVIYHCPPAAGDPTALSKLLEALTEVVLADDAAFAQVLLPPRARAAADAFVQAGYRHLARLIYLRRDLSDVAQAVPAPPAGELSWPTLAEFDEQQLGQVIADTYVDSHDCPALLGLRPMVDVIAGHKSSGIFRPQWWWMPTLDGECAGCVLVNEAFDVEATAEVVYLGVRPAWRRRGIARAMIRHAIVVAASEGMKALHLAVDAANTVAAKLYRQQGFREIQQKDAYIRVPRCQFNSA